jgi:hypothetical protein
VLKGDKDMPDLVVVSVYGTKPVHFISTVCDCIEWVLKTKKVWNERKQRMENLRFLRLNVNDDYNKDMNAVDIADQLRNNYRFDHWLRNFKWWWSIFLWVFGVLLVNPYIVYTSVCDANGVPVRNQLTRNQFCLSVAKVWIAKNGEEIIARWKASHNMSALPYETPMATAPTRRREKSPMATPASRNRGSIQS